MNTTRNSRLAVYSGIYAILYSLFLYQNLKSITFTLFTITTLVYIRLVTKEFNLNWKKDTNFIAVAATLISISHPLTDKGFIHFFNFVFVFILLIYIALHQFVFDSNWTFLQTFGNIFLTVANAIANFFSPFRDLAEYRSTKEYNSEETDKKIPWAVIIITVVVTLPVLAVITAMLSGADAVFNKLLNNIFDWIVPDFSWIKVVALSALVFMFTYGLFKYLLRFSISAEGKTYKQYSPVAAITAGIMFDFVYVIFCIIQIFYLFIGNFDLPNEMTYAEYARQGFFSLLFICLFNLVLVLIGSSFFSENKVLKVILTVLCGCTYIMTASSAFRMILYIRYYYFTFLRVLVLWALALIAVLLTGLLLTIWKKKFNLFKFSLTAILAAYILLAFSHTDYFVVKWNLSQVDGEQGFFLENGYEDYDYIAYETCLDSAPLVFASNELDKEVYIGTDLYKYSTIYAANFDELRNNTSIRKFNVSQFIAKISYEKYLQR